MFWEISFLVVPLKYSPYPQMSKFTLKCIDFSGTQWTLGWSWVLRARKLDQGRGKDGERGMAEANVPGPGSFLLWCWLLSWSSLSMVTRASAVVSKGEGEGSLPEGMSSPWRLQALLLCHFRRIISKEGNDLVNIIH